MRYNLEVASKSAKISAGLVLCRKRAGAVEFLLVHPGGPLFARKWAGWWTIPKGLIGPGEAPVAAARREFVEETGFDLPADTPLVSLGEITQKSGKRVVAWAAWGDADPAALRSNSFELEWPRGSGRIERFPEVDRARWCTIAQARVELMAAQLPLLKRARLLL